MTTAGILSVLPEGIDADAGAALETLANALTSLPDGVEVRFDPTLVRGMGYYTGTIFEIAHPASGSSIGGGGRYDGMIGRFLGQDVPAAGFSIGFERIVDLIEVDESSAGESIVLVHDTDVSLSTLIGIKNAFVARGVRVRLEKRVKNVTPLLERARLAGFDSFAFVGANAVDATSLLLKPLS